MAETPRQPATPDPYQDTEAIHSLVKSRFDEWSRGRENFTWNAYRNIFFFRGRQWIEFTRRSLTGWQPVKLAPGTPMPVTNKFARVMSGFIAMLARFEPSLQFAPGSEDAEDRAAADVASRAIRAVEDEVNITTHRHALAKWVGLTGGAWRETGYDNDPAHGVVDVPVLQCTGPECGHMEPPPVEMEAIEIAPSCPECRMPMEETAAQMPKGRLYVDEVSVLEMFFDPSVTDWLKQKACLRQKAVDLEDAKRRWKHLGDAIAPDSMGAGGNQFMEQLPTLGPHFEDGRRVGLSAARQSNTKVTENWFHMLPTEAYPEGLCAVLLGKIPTTVAYAGPMRYVFTEEDGSTRPFLPYVFFPQDEVPGTAWPKTVADDLAPKQVSRNKWEAMIEMSGKRMANHVWLSPRGAAMSTPTGIPGQHIEYNAIGPANAKPERLEGRPVPPSFIENIGRIDQEMDDLAAQYEVLRGDRPAGISAGISLQILKERGEAQYGPMFIKWNHAEAQWARQALAIARQYWTEARLRKIKGRDGAWEVQKFLGADLSGRVDVVPEAGITLPRSTMTDRAEIEQLYMLGLLNPADPETRMESLKAYGKLAFLPSLEKDTKRVYMDIEKYEAMAQEPAVLSVVPEIVMQMRQMIQMAPTPMVALAAVEQEFALSGVPLPKFRPAIDDHAIHARELRNFAKSERFDALPEIIQTLVELRVSAHDFLAAQAMQAMVMAREGTNPAGGFLARPGPNPGSAPSTSPMKGGSSQARMDGDQREAESRMGQPVG